MVIGCIGPMDTVGPFQNGNYLRLSVTNPLDMSSVKIEEVYSSGSVRRSKLEPCHVMYHLAAGNWAQVSNPPDWAK